MSLNQPLLAELAQEAATTRRMLERVPAAHILWQPHAKSMTLGRLATHIAELPSWMTMTLKTTYLDFAETEWKPKVFSTSDELVAHFDEVLAEATQALQAATDEDLFVPWSMKQGEQVFFTMPRIQVIRSMVLNHMVHHRGQLSVYLRLLDVPLPGSYGPTADESPV
jgi:uncharacterized damage-inducible protein DinB